MTLQPDDPRLTAYALGECDEAERAEIEQYLEQNPEARAEVDLVRAVGEQLTEEFRKEPTPALTDLQHKQIEMASARVRRPWTRMLAYAASLLVVLGVGAVYLQLQKPRGETLAMGNIPHSAVPKSAAAVANNKPLRPSNQEAIAKKEAAPASEPVIQQEKLYFSPPPQMKDQAASGDGGVNAPAPEPSLDAQGIRPYRITVPQAESSDASRNTQQDPELKQKQKLYDEAVASKHSAGSPAPAEVKERTDTAASEYDTVTVGGSIQIRGNWRDYPAPGAIDQRGCIMPPPPACPPPVSNTELYATINENSFLTVANEPLSTFSIDVDTASYANVRRFLNQGQLPPADAVRIEELINYFKYDYPQPTGDAPFSVNVEVNACPWNPAHSLARIGLRGKVPPMAERPACNLIFLLDISGSMQAENKLPLLKRSMTMLAETLAPNDRIGIVVYDSIPRVVLEPTPTSNLGTIRCAINSLQSNGSTNGADGLRLAYNVARRTFIEGGINRILVGTDGDFNVGTTDKDELIQMIQQQAKSGVFLSVLGFGMGNLKDANLEGLADKGNGNYAYIDTFNEARRVLLEQAASTIITIAKDVKIQVEFNPGKVGAYRLIGYENRALAAQDFNDDKKDAGEIGAGHTVTALYELVPPGEPVTPNVDALKYQPMCNVEQPAAPPASDSNELMTVKLRYKLPDGDTSTKLEVPVTGVSEGAASADYQFQASVAAFGMLLRDSQYKGTVTFDMVSELAQRGKGNDSDGTRSEFIGLISIAKALKSQR